MTTVAHISVILESYKDAEKVQNQSPHQFASNSSKKACVMQLKPLTNELKIYEVDNREEKGNLDYAANQFFFQILLLTLYFIFTASIRRRLISPVSLNAL